MITLIILFLCLTILFFLFNKKKNKKICPLCNSSDTENKGTYRFCRNCLKYFVIR